MCFHPESINLYLYLFSALSGYIFFSTNCQYFYFNFKNRNVRGRQSVPSRTVSHRRSGNANSGGTKTTNCQRFWNPRRSAEMDLGKGARRRRYEHIERPSSCPWLCGVFVFGGTRWVNKYRLVYLKFGTRKQLKLSLFTGWFLKISNWLGQGWLADSSFTNMPILFRGMFHLRKLNFECVLLLII